MDSEYKYIVAYAIAGIIFFLIIKTKIGYVFMYYSLLLAILFVFVTQYKFISKSLAPIAGDYIGVSGVSNSMSNVPIGTIIGV